MFIMKDWFMPMGYFTREMIGNQTKDLKSCRSIVCSLGECLDLFLQLKHVAINLESCDTLDNHILPLFQPYIGKNSARWLHQAGHLLVLRLLLV